MRRVPGPLQKARPVGVGPLGSPVQAAMQGRREEEQVAGPKRLCTGRLMLGGEPP